MLQSPSLTGSETRFRVEQLAESGTLSVVCDGESFDSWRATGSGTIEIDTEIGEHSFEIRGGGGVARAERSSAGRSVRSVGREGSLAGPGGGAVNAQTMRSANLLLSSGAGVCPCCAG